MIGISAGDEDALGRLAQVVEVIMRDARRRFVGGRPAGAVEDVVQVARGQLGEPGGEFRGRRVAEVGEVGVLGQGAELIRRRLDQLPAAEADVGEPQPADAVDEPVPLGVPYVRSLAAHHDGGTAPGPLGEVRPRMDAVIEIGLVKAPGVVVLQCWHLFLRLVSTARSSVAPNVTHRSVLLRRRAGRRRSRFPPPLSAFAGTAAPGPVLHGSHAFSRA